METVGKIRSYISKGVYIVSGSFHPFGGAIDIIVVQQPDGTFKSSPWYVKFGKFQGVLKTREKIVKLCVNGVEADVNMYLNHKGEAYFLQEVEEEDTAWKPQGGSSASRHLKSKSCGNFDTNRHRSKGMSYGRRSYGEDLNKEGDAMERAEIVAELLEYKWSTNLYSRRRMQQLKTAGVCGSIDSSDVNGAKVCNGENNKGGFYVSGDGNPGDEDVCFRSNGFTVGTSSAKEEKSGSDESRSSSDISGSSVAGSECSERSDFGILSPPETVKVEEEVESVLQTVTNSGSGESVIVNTVASSRPPFSSVYNHDGDRSRNDCIPANGRSKSQMDVPVRFHIGDSEESRHVRVDSSPHRGRESSHEHLPSQSPLDGNMTNIQSPRRSTTSQIMNGMKRVESVPDMASRLRSTSECAFHHSRSQSVDSSAPMLASSLSPNETGSAYVSGSPEDGRESLCCPSSPDSRHTNCSQTIRPRLVRKMIRVLKPTSNQLASLNLKEGCNVVTFLFSTSMLGKQQVDARIYLWKWDTRVIISDVDGTITKSDVLGQFMPLMGMDWSHVGVTTLYSSIKENGYHMLFLSARAITQAYLTRRFLINLSQNGKTLPDGPVVISPDGLFPSLYREVIIRRPHEFKIACLEEIKSLFPPDCNPFYAGFGNRDTDEISYLKVGIPKGKIFIINPKGEVAVNRHVDPKSYTSLHSLVHGMFPSTISAEQEDFNSWNFWKMPLPLMDM